MKFLIPIVLFAFSTSCQRGVDDINPPLPSTKTDSVLISRYVELDTTVGPLADTVRKWLFFYDNMKRLSVWEFYTYKNGIMDPLETEKRTFYYNSADTLPYKQVNISNYDTISTYQRFVNGKLVSDFAIRQASSFTETEMDRYSYYPNRFVDSFWQNITNASLLDKNYISCTFQKVNDLTISQRDTTVYDYDKPGPWRMDINDHLYTYDTYHNPFYILHKFYPPVCEFGGTPTIIGIERCNVIEAKTAILFPPPMSSDHIRFVYQYNSHGYPATVRISDVNNPSVVRKGLYFYTK